MSPLVLVGIILSIQASRSDVSHVLNEQAKEINFLAQDGNNFWWNDSDSPLKKAESQYRSVSIASNPFLNGEFSEGVGQSTAHISSVQGPEKIDLSNNPFFNGGVQSGLIHAGDSQQQPHQPSEQGLSCKGAGYTCTKKQDCHNGATSGEHVIQARTQAYCDPKTEICCKITPNTNDYITAGKSSVPGSTIKLQGTLGNSPSLIHVLPNEPKLSVSNLGETGADINRLGPSTPKATRDAQYASTPDYSNVHFGDDVRFASTIRGPAYLPPVDETRPRPSTGYPPATSPAPVTYQPKPFCGTGEEFVNGRCVPRQPSCGSNEILQGGRCVPRQPSCGPNEILQGGRCVPRQPSCGPNEILQGGRCVPRQPTCGPNEILQGGRCVPRQPSCGPNEILQGGRCVPRQPSCGPNEILQGGRCVPRQPSCSPNEILQGGRCVPRQPSCSPNEVLQGGRCVPRQPSCGPNEILQGDRCVPRQPSCSYNEEFVGGRCVPKQPSCGPNEIFQGGRCVPRQPSCGPNEIFQGGRCVPRQPSCGPNEILQGGRCVPRATTPTPTEYLPPKCGFNEELVGGRCRPKQPSCGPNEIFQGGRCVPRQPSCGPNEIFQGGRCVPRQPSCGPNEILQGGRCVPRQPSCGPNEIFQGGRCVPRQPSCGPNEVLQGGRCVPRQPSCSYDEELVGGRCVPKQPSCGPNEIFQGGRCVPRQPSCGPNEVLQGGRCVPRQPSCSYDEELVGGRCVPKQKSCGPNEIFQGGRCVPRQPSCGPNEVLQGGRCVPRQPSCGPNEIFQGGRCVPRQPSCGPNEVLQGGRCVPRQPSCGPNEIFQGGRCVPRQPSCGYNEQLVNGQCVPKTPLQPLKCQPYEHLVGGVCVTRPPSVVQCGPNEIQQGGRCVPRTPSCGPNEILQGGRCVPRQPSCRFNEQLVNGQCVPRQPSCGYNEQLINGQCIPGPTPRPSGSSSTTSREYLPPTSCGYNEVLQGNVCVPKPVVCTGNTYNQNGRCVPITTPRPDCPPNTRYQNGRCVPISTQPPTGGYSYPTPAPTINRPSSYLPPFGEENSGSDINGVYVPTTTTRRPGTVPIGPTGSTRPPGDKYQPDGSGPPPSIIVPTDQNNVVLPSCAAALKCVQEIYCTAEGFISPVPVVFSKEQELNRVPLTECADREAGITGKCCRDPDYKDPWPSANLVNGIDNGQYREDPNLGQYSLNNNRLVRSNQNQQFGNPAQYQQQQVQEQQPQCGVRNFDTQPKGPGALDAHFAEIPWQAMILRDSNRSLLCGGAIIRNNAVLTSAHCVEGLEASDVLIKGGEWKLGIDEEPLPFQIVNVRRIVMHPNYNRELLHNDLAILILEDRLRPAKNVDAICLPRPNERPAGNCIATGWGKKILQIHLKGAIMRQVDVNVMGPEECQNQLQSYFPQAVSRLGGTTICGKSNADQCKVDHGSALACTTDGRHYTLHGIFSWDTSCKDEKQIGAYVLPDVEWIESTLAH